MICRAFARCSSPASAAIRTRCTGPGEAAAAIVDHWWQTETGWSIAANCWGIEHLPVKPGSPTKAVPGYDVRVLDEAGNEQKPGAIGSIVMKLPLPPGNSPTLWQNERRYVRSYLSRYEGYYLTGDAGYR